MKPVSLISIVLGLVLLLGSFAWTLIFPPGRTWTVEKNNQMTALGEKGHALGGELDAAQRKPTMHGRSATDIEAEYNQVKAELAQLREEYQNDRDAPQTTASIMRWVGVGLVAIGAALNYTGRA